MRLRFFLLQFIALAIMVLTSLGVNATTTDSKNSTSVRSYSIRYSNQVRQLLNQINPQNMWADLITLTNFPDRAANHNSGIAAANLIRTQVETLVKNSGREDTKIFMVETIGKDPWSGQSFTAKQPSIILQIGIASNPGIIIGAHFDTLHCDDEGCIKDPYGPLPGANDDGSGTVTVLEVARTLLNSNMHFNNPIYLIWYAAEEAGDWGSIAVVDHFKKNNIPVKAVMQLDQTGFAYNNESTIWLETNKGRTHKVVDDDLTNYLLILTETYVKKPVSLSCSGSSDEEIWTINGFAAARPLEADYCDYSRMYHYMHRNQDTMDKISLVHMTDYLKLAIAFAVELAEPIKT
jgi:leucyl aminopeptidase